MEDAPTEEQKTRRVVDGGSKTQQFARALVDLVRRQDADLNDDGVVSKGEREAREKELHYHHAGMKLVAKTVMVLWLGTMIIGGTILLLYHEKVSDVFFDAGSGTAGLKK